MVDLIPQPGPLVTAQAPRSGVSPQDVAQPYSELADNLGKVSQGAESFAEQAATQAGFKAVTRDADGNLQVSHMPIIGPASQNYEHAMKIAALAEGEGLAKDADIRLRQEFLNDPEGYLNAANAYKDKTIADWSSKGAPEVGLAIGKVIDSATTYSYRALWNQKQHNDLKAAGATIDSGIQDATDNLTALARGGDTSSDAFQQNLDKVRTLINQKVSNPLFAYPKEQADYDLQHLQGQLRGQAFLHEIDNVYQSAPSKADGAKAALAKAQEVLTDPSLKISQQERQQFYSRAVGEVHAQEALRRQDIQEAHSAEMSLRMVTAYGGKLAPTDIEGVANAYRAAGAPGDVARLYAWASRAPLNDDFGRQPLPAQTDQLNELRGAPRQKAAYDYLKSQYGLNDAQASGIIGGLRGETENLNTAQIHDGGIGIGIAGWNSDRRAALNAFAQQQGKNPFDLKTQLDFVMHELGTSEKVSGDQLRSAQTPEQAAAAMLNYLRPAGYDQPGAHPERARYARMAFNTFAGVQSDAGPGGNPAESLWLQANRTHVLDKTAQQAWSTVQEDWGKKGIKPSDDTVLQVTNAARAANDWPLLEQIKRDTDRFNLAQQQAGEPLPAQQAAITSLEAAGQSGSLTPGQQAVMNDLQRRYTAIKTGLEKNPIATTVANFPDQFKALPPLDYSDPQMLSAGLAARGKIAAFASANWQSGPVAALDEADMAQMKSILQGPDVAAKASVFGALSALPEDVRNATLGKLAKKGGPDMAVGAAAGSMLREAPEIAMSILRGQMAEKTDKAYWPKGGAEEQATQDALAKALPPSTFGLASRTDPQGAYATAQGMVKARYADLSAQAGDVSGKLNPDRLTQAVSDVTGGVLDHNGAPLIAPQRGMSQADFDRTLTGISDSDLAGVTTLNGKPVTADYLRSSAQLESIGNGQYLLRLGRDTSRPIYAYQGANGEVPQKFVLDLRGRQPGPLPVPTSADLMTAGVP